MRTRLIEIIKERPGKGGRLGRHIEHDQESRNYEITTAKRSLVSRVWNRVIPAFDQGNLGACTGNAILGVLATEPHYNPDSMDYSEKTAVEIYKKATKLDRIPGSYPPEDTGSSGLAAAKAAVKLGLFDGAYRHAFKFSSWLESISFVGPIAVGVNWYEGMDEPKGLNARIEISGESRGGHEIEILGIDVAAKEVLIINSWGVDWGNKGYARISFSDLERLRDERGDCTVLVKG